MELVHMHWADGVIRSEIWHGDAVDWEPREGMLKPDLVLTNPYGPMPAALRGLRMVLHQWAYRKHELERHAGIPQGSLELIGQWNDRRECFWAANIEDPPILLELEAFKPEPGGWYPLEVPRLILQTYAQPGMTIWDGFMGRGTVAKACRELGLNYIGVEQLRAHVDLALDYLELRPKAA